MSHFSPNEEKSPILEAIKRCRAGDEDAARFIWGHYCPSIEAMVARFLSRRELARGVGVEDVVIEVFDCFFTKLKEGIFTFEHEDEVWKLLLTIARHKVRDAIEELPRAHIFHLAFSESLLHADSAPEEEAIAREQLEQFLTGLSEERRHLANLHMQGFTIAEIVNLLGRSESHVRKELSKLRTKLDIVTRAADDKWPPGDLADSLSLQGTPRLPRDWQADPVDCTVFAPPEVYRHDVHMVQVVAHTPAQADEARDLANECDDKAKRRGFTSLETEVTRGSKLFFHLVVPGTEIEYAHRNLIWQGRPASVQFRVAIPQDYGAKSAVGTVTVSNEDQIPLGQITFTLAVRSQPKRRLPTPQPTGQAKSFDLFFISYASEDRPEVLKRVQMLVRLGKRFFQDLLDLAPGDRWERKLYLFIDESDATLLFWSSSAKKSEWVMRECRYTIEKKGIERLLPVIIEGPPLVEPPEELRELHMSDWLLYVMDASSRERSLRLARDMNQPTKEAET